jgi:EAL domain-containing protein (putative c-di-GMP-specific phosphodiesterase class I)
VFRPTWPLGFVVIPTAQIVPEARSAVMVPVTVWRSSTREQLDTITDMGCDSAQGFFLSRPREPDLIEPLLRL